MNTASIPLNFTQESSFSFEDSFDNGIEFALWLGRNMHIPICSSIFYVLLIFSLQHVMKDRTPFDLRRILVAWSAVLAIFSIIGAVKTVPERLYVTGHFGWKHTVCNLYHYSGPVSFWSGLFVLSKLYELGDTVFIVLRKQKLIFLHWYHHITVLIYTWYSYSEQQTLGRCFVAMNFSVHALMYSYYTLRALRVKVPKTAAMCVTVLQIAQMVGGVISSGSAFYYMRRGQKCDTNYTFLFITFGIYGSYFLLFANYFIKSYITFKPNKQLAAKKLS